MSISPSPDNEHGKIVGKFYPLLHEEYLRLRTDLKPNELDIYLYLATKNPFDNPKIEVDTATISEQLGYHRRTVQLAIKRLEEKKLIKVDVIRFKYQVKKTGDLQTHPGDLQTHPGDLQTHPGDLQTHLGDLQTHLGDLQTHIETPEAASGTGFGVPKTLKTLLDLEDSLLEAQKTKFFTLGDERERENFLIFGRRQASQLPKPPVLTIKWIASCFDELLDKYLEETNKSQSKADKATKQEPRYRSKEQEEFLKRNEDPSEDPAGVPRGKNDAAPAGSAASPDEIAAIDNMLNEPEERPEDAKQGASKGGVDRAFIEELKRKHKDKVYKRPIY